MKVGEVVLIAYPLKSRLFWTIGRVVSSFTGKDKNVRSVTVRRFDGSECVYSINPLYPLEIGSSGDLVKDTSFKL